VAHLDRDRLAKAVLFSPESDRDAVVRRRIRVGELLDLAGDIEQSLAQLEVLDIDQLRRRTSSGHCRGCWARRRWHAGRLDPPLAEACVALGQTGDAMRISACLREIGGRLDRPGLTGTRTGSTPAPGRGR